MLATGTLYRKGYGPFMGGVIHVPYPHACRFPLDATHKSAEQIAGEYVVYLLHTLCPTPSPPTRCPPRCR